ncbi:hypothetical protein INS49_010699 [Diaporthe citri]|uniref:uncharacterized protein n=1 Tax=Diaporthe citri TaxID=83186 RepID=UPI001C813EF8|nr:uncharacterized protein INS49_010699 [Diaporthe citri]KAG6362469.1 hypothetical protein INS49_010699 [Diaporthe citri]
MATTEQPPKGSNLGTPGMLSERDSSDTSMMPQQEPKAAPKAGFMTRLREEIDPAHSDLPVLATCFVSGICDSVAFNASSVFVSMQTGKSPSPPWTYWQVCVTDTPRLTCHPGNTIFLALGTANLPFGAETLWLRALVSIVCFWAGCFFFSQSRRVGPKGKATLAGSFFIQSAFILIAAAVSQGGVVPAFGMKSLGTAAARGRLASYETESMTLLPVALLAFQFGGQIVTSRVLGFNEVPTNVLTSLYCDLFSDPLIIAPIGKNVKRNRRVVAVLLMVAGGIIGAWLQKSKAGMPAALWIGGAIKMVIAVCWLAWRSKTVVHDEKV